VKGGKPVSMKDVVVTCAVAELKPTSFSRADRWHVRLEDDKRLVGAGSQLTRQMTAAKPFNHNSIISCISL